MSNPRGTNANVPQVPTPVAELGSLTAAVQALKQGVDSLAGYRGGPLDRAVTFKDLVSLKLISGLAALSGGVGGGVTDVTTLTGILGTSQGGTGADLHSVGGAHIAVWLETVGGAFTVRQPSFSDLLGVIAPAQIADGSIANAKLTNSSIMIAGHVVPLGGSQTLAASDLTNGTTGSGAVVLADSGALIGTPTAPTATPGTNTTQLATCAFVNTAIGAAVTSVSNSDGTLTISPTTGAVVASLALGHVNHWTGAQTIDTVTVVTINKLTLTQPATGATLTIADGKTLTDTSGVGASILLGAAAGGFTGYVGTSGAAHQWITALSAAGVGTFAQPATSDLSDISTFTLNTSGTGTLTSLTLTGTLGSGYIALQQGSPLASPAAGFMTVGAISATALAFLGNGSFQVNLDSSLLTAARNFKFPNNSGNIITTGDTGTVTNTMLAGSIANAKLTNSSLTIGSTSISLGATAATVSGLTLSGGTLSGATTLPGSGTIDSNGHLLTGYGSALALGGSSGADRSQIVSTTTAGYLQIVQYGSGVAFGSNLRFGKSRAATPASTAAVTSGDTLGQVSFAGDDGTLAGSLPVLSASILTAVNGTVSAGIVPADIRFSTMNAAGTFAERARLFASGGVSIGNTTDPGAGNLSVSGTVAPKGYTVATLPAAGTAGRRAHVTDSNSTTFLATVAGGGTNVVPVFDNGTAWKIG